MNKKSLFTDLMPKLDRAEVQQLLGLHNAFTVQHDRVKSIKAGIQDTEHDIAALKSLRVFKLNPQVLTPLNIRNDKLHSEFKQANRKLSATRGAMRALLASFAESRNAQKPAPAVAPEKVLTRTVKTPDGRTFEINDVGQFSIDLITAQDLMSKLQKFIQVAQTNPKYCRGILKVESVKD